MLTLGLQIPPSLFAAIIVAAGATMCLIVLRLAKYPVSGRAVIAGTIAGLLIGPTVGGRVFPAHFEQLFIGGVKEREAVQYARWFATNAPAAIKGMTDETRAAQRDIDQKQIALKQAELESARWKHQQSLRVFAMAAAALTLLAAMFASIRAGDRRQGLVTPLSVGIWSFALPGALAYIAAVQWWDTTITEAALLAAAIGIGPWAVGCAIERRIADDAEFGGARMMQTAGRIASMLAIVLAMCVAWKARGIPGAMLMTPLLALPLSWLGDVFVRSEQRTLNTDQKYSRAIHFIAELLVAILAALVAIRIDLHASMTLTMLAMVVVLALLADDGRWTGALLGALLPGDRPALRTMRLVMLAMTAGPTQLAVAALALHAWLLPDRFALPLLAGVILIEATAPARRSMAARLVELEREVDEADDE